MREPLQGSVQTSEARSQIGRAYVVEHRIQLDPADTDLWCFVRVLGPSNSGGEGGSGESGSDGSESGSGSGSESVEDDMGGQPRGSGVGGGGGSGESGSDGSDPIVCPSTPGRTC